jgi:hypothetical protein
MFNHPWDEKLKHIHDEKSNKSKKYSPPVLPEIFLECGVGFHPRLDFSSGFGRQLTRKPRPLGRGSCLPAPIPTEGGASRKVHNMKGNTFLGSAAL